MKASTGQKVFIAMAVLSLAVLIPVVGWVALALLIPLGIAWQWKVSAAWK